MSLRGGGDRRRATLGTRVSYRFLRAGRTRHRAAGVRSAALPAALRRSCITGHRINPKPDVLGQYRRPQSPRVPASGSRAPRVLRAFHHILPDYLLPPPPSPPSVRDAATRYEIRRVVLTVIDRGAESRILDPYMLS